MWMYNAIVYGFNRANTTIWIQFKVQADTKIEMCSLYQKRARRGREHMLVGITTIYAISAHHH
jgi:hypothetical protein